VALRDPATGAQALLLFDADLVATPATVTAIVKLDSSGRNELSLLSMILPLVTGIVGAVALIAGILLARKPHEAEASSEAEAPSAAEAPSEESAERSVVPGMDGEPPDR